MARKNLIILLAAVMVLTGGCGKAPVSTLVAPTLLPEETGSPIPLPSITATRTVVPLVTATHAPTSTLRPSLTPILFTGTPTPKPGSPIASYVSPLSGLAPGQYVLYLDDTGPALTFGLVSLDGERSLTFEVNDGSIDIAFTRNGERVVIAENENLRIHNLLDGSTTALETGRECRNPEWSPDGTKIVAVCDEDLYLIPLGGGDRLNLTSSFSDGYRSHPRWSPDGRWIAFGYDSGLGPSSPRGVYILDIACFTAMETCASLSKGLFLSALGNPSFFDMDWSPDSRHLAVLNHPDDETIYILDIQSNEVESLAPPQAMIQIMMAWSPDGEYLAFTCPISLPENHTRMGIYLRPVDGGSPILLRTEGGFVETWIIRPYPFIPGDLYTVTEAGSDLNLRDTPSLSGTILQTLQPGDTVTILAGPVEADGYTWWQMQTDDGTAGWAVNIPEWYAPVGMTTTATP